MVKKYSLSGISLPNSITFFGDKYSAEINTKTKKVQVFKTNILSSTKQVKFLDKIRFLQKIPFIRGLYLLLQLIIKMFFSVDKIWRFIIIITLAYLFLSPSVEPVSKGWFWDNYFFFIMYGFLIYMIFSARKNHSIEHKLIGAYEDDKDLSLKNIKKQPKEHRRCGGVIASWYITFYILMNLLGLHIGDIHVLIFFSVSYELGLLARRNNIIGKFFFVPGYLIQKITTTKNIKEKDIVNARKALVFLLKKEHQSFRGVRT